MRRHWRVAGTEQPCPPSPPANSARHAHASNPAGLFPSLPPAFTASSPSAHRVLPHRSPDDRKKASEQAWFDARSATWKRDEEIRDRSANRQQLDEARCVTRAAHTRYVEKFQYGYNIVDHKLELFGRPLKRTGGRD